MVLWVKFSQAIWEKEYFKVAQHLKKSLALNKGTAICPFYLQGKISDAPHYLTNILETINVT